MVDAGSEGSKLSGCDINDASSASSIVVVIVVIDSDSSSVQCTL